MLIKTDQKTLVIVPGSFVSIEYEKDGIFREWDELTTSERKHYENLENTIETLIQHKK